MTSPPPRKSTSRSPPILPPEFLTPAVPGDSPRAERAEQTSTSDIGVLRLSGQISQNEDRLPKPPSQLRKQGSGSESSGSGSGPQSVSLTEIPFLDDSPVGYSVGHSYTQDSSSSTSPKGGQFTLFRRESQSMEAHSDIGIVLSMPDSGPETSYSHQSSSHSENASFSSHNLSSESSGSKGANSSFSSSLNSRSSGSQASNMSFINADTSTPRSTPIPIVASLGSTPSDSEQTSSSSQASPVSKLTTTATSSRRRQIALDIQGRGAGPSQPKSFPTIPENDILETSDTQQTEPFGTDPSLEEVEAAISEVEESHLDTTQIYESELNQKDDDAGKVALPTGSILAEMGLSPSNVLYEKKNDPKGKNPITNTSVDSTGQNYEYLSSDDDDASRSAMSNKLDLHISQSQANIVHSLSLQSRKISSSSSISSRETSSVTAEITQKGHELRPEDLNKTTADDTGRDDTGRDDVPVNLATETASEDPTSTIRQSTPPPHNQASDAPSSPHQTKPQKSIRSSQDLPSSQSSASSHSSSDPILRRLRSAASQDATHDHVFSAVPKRRRPNAAEITPLHVVSSIGEEGEFWEGSDKNAPAPQEHYVRSRSGSQDISSYPEDFPSEQDLEEIFSFGAEEAKVVSQQEEDEPASPPESPGRGTSSQHSSLLQRPRTSQPRELRRKSASQASPSTTPTRRNLRRLHSATEALRSYKVNESVWARWRTSYYAGKVTTKDSDRYGIHFLDEDFAYCDGAHMRPLKLRLGAEVLASKTETMDHSATVEGIHMATEIEQSRVDVRFEDETEANLSLRQISLTEDMMSKLDKDMDWDEDTRPTLEVVPSVPEPPAPTISRQTSSISAPSGTPRKSKNKPMLIERSLSVPLTPSRRSRGDKLSNVGPSSPSRRGKDLFKDHTFVLSLTAPGGSKELDQEISSKIKAGGGIILEDFSSALERRPSPNLFLISHTTVRTPKFLEALAMNITRLSYRWIEHCVANRQLMPYSSYMLPTGLSLELETIVSSTPLNDRGIFDGLNIGLCGTPQFRTLWERTIKGTGATIVPVNPKTGPKSCNYIVFSGPKAHRHYCDVNVAVPSLTTEWIVQCLINQRVMAINGHPSYTNFPEKPAPK
ncbi:hypothetical protein BGZ80_011261 [Entomortierella chlamydospora]|uniref:BRCT domain-containing protein n=1 Tax=Entomortierella chlamydospora TaxID=101097 RepID=A0A9P6MUF3_9FUNG|nr:hypothetical protein BGZ80_011261 [Entomortierella chlamydospora]